MPASTDGIAARYLLADRGSCTGGLIDNAAEFGCEIVIPSRKNCQRGCDKDIRRVRFLVENAFLHLRQWCWIAIGDAKALAAFVADVQIRRIALWLKALV